MATNGHSGYPLKWFKEQNAARSSFECSICLEVLKDAVQVGDCGHQFCAQCIEDILKSDPRCPSCRIRISKQNVFKDHAARRLIKKLDVNCCNDGCSWIGSLGSLLEAHMNSCRFLVGNKNNANQSDAIAELQARFESLVLKVSSLEKVHKNEMEEVNSKVLQRENELKQLKLKHDEEVKELKDQILFFGRYTSLPATSGQSLEQLRQNLTVSIALTIPNFTHKLNQARSSNQLGEIHGDPFNNYHGYRMKIAVHVNEAPRGSTGYMGVYLYLLQGDNDDKLEWPFNKRVTFIVVDQQNNEAFVHNHEKDLHPGGEEQFEKPMFGRINQGRGFSQFVLHSTLRKRQYVRNHTLYIAVSIRP
ncbi:TNF receptor-associated factor 4-like isoform X2 [Dendronephthya gigantea]|uniref:TNF receptor-associated factor 4-like isoform X2 n=1 Tax=Dendronephthya gigantea TaxID=151771 RepID=UPI0010694143|nr:TNF receptor-associated factor 4-like isoform X2 [Dendronephthya gigantea]